MTEQIGIQAVGAKEGPKGLLAFGHYTLDDTTISPLSLRVYIHLVRRSKDHETVWITMRQLKDHMLTGLDQIVRSVKELEDMGLITRIKASAKGTLYRFAKRHEWECPVQFQHPCLSVPELGTERSRIGNASVPESGTLRSGRRSGHEEDPSTATSGPGADSGSVDTPPSQPKESEPAPPPDGATPPPHQRFIQLWHDAYLEKFGYRYCMAGGKDGSAVKRLLRNMEGQDPEDLVAIAKKAWRFQSFRCKQAKTIAGFVGSFNHIMSELPLLVRGIDPDGNMNFQLDKARQALQRMRDNGDGADMVPDRVREAFIRQKELVTKLEALVHGRETTPSQH